MIATAQMDVILKNEKDNFEMLTCEVEEVADEIEVYSCFFNPSLKRGWVGDLTYYCHKGYIVHSCEEVEDKELMTIKDVLLRNVRCYKLSEHEAALWKYTFLKD
jgi:hypothetical protein